MAAGQLDIILKGKYLKIAVVPVIFIGIGWLVLGPGVTKFRSWNAGRLLDESRRHLEKSNWSEAERASMASLQLHASLEAYRILFRAAKAGKSSKSLQVAISFFHHPEATRQDRLEVLDYSLESEDLLAASHLLRAIPPEELRTAEFALRLSKVHLQQEEWDNALRIAEAFDDSSARGQFDLLLVPGLARSGETKYRDEVESRVTRLLKQPPDEYTIAMMRILANLRSDWQEKELAQTAFNCFDEASVESLTPADRLSLAKLELRIRPDSSGEIIRRVVTEFKTEARDELVEWLSQIGEWDQIILLTDSQTLARNSFNHRMTALSRLGKLDQLWEELENPPIVVPQPVLLAVKATVAKSRGSTADSIVLWKRAFDAAEIDLGTNHFYRIATIAGQAGDSDRHLDALARGIEHPLGVPPRARKLDPLFTWIITNKGSRRLKSITYKLLRREPGNPILINNFHYLQSVFGNPAPNSLSIMKQLVENFPENDNYKSSLALVQIKSGTPEEALQTLSLISKEFSGLNYSEKAIRCAALAAAGKPEEALPLSERIEWTLFAEDEANAYREMIHGDKS
ncbi:MAG: hypothetical protein AAGA58_11100 [Verrucomicrobiota bacterium]